MIKTFTKEYYLNHRGCYSEEKMEGLVDNNPHSNLQEFLNWNISIKDKFYFIRNYTELTVKQKQLLALLCAKVSLEIYENKYPDDKRVRECIEATESFIAETIDKEQLLEKRQDAYAAYVAAAAAAYAAAADAADAAAADAAAADAADAAYVAAAAAAYAAAADAADAAAADAAAADAADKKDYHKTKLLNALKQFCIEQE